MVPEHVPGWLTELESKGLRPYAATSRKLLPYLNTTPFNRTLRWYLLDEPADRAFLEAYLLANSLSFTNPTFKMPHWILIDCVLMQTAIVGFSLALDRVPEPLREHFEADPGINLGDLTELPLSGQISALNIDGRSLTGFSLFSLARYLTGVTHLSLYTKALALEVYKARSLEACYGITQYDNPSLRVHGRFTNELELYQPLVPLHPGKDRTLIYKMVLDYDPQFLHEKKPACPPTFWLNANDLKRKEAIAAGIAGGKRYLIMPPFCEFAAGVTSLPVLEIGGR
jgi:hypothetical protein